MAKYPEFPWPEAGKEFETWFEKWLVCDPCVRPGLESEYKKAAVAAWEAALFFANNIPKEEK